LSLKFPMWYSQWCFHWCFESFWCFPYMFPLLFTKFLSSQCFCKVDNYNFKFWVTSICSYYGLWNCLAI
jgi:hypothetical protein